MTSGDQIGSNGAYVNWETDVNLSPPKGLGKEASNEDKLLHTYYNALQRILYETGQPETIDRTQRPRKLQNKECVNVAILSSPAECIGILLEGGNQLSDGFHLVLSTSWLSTVPSEEDVSLSTLLLHKSISFHASGASFIDEFETPRRVTYFVNNFTNVTNGHHNAALGSEITLDCPMGTSAKLSKVVDDTVWARDIMAEAGMEIPETLAVRRMPARNICFEKHKIKCIDFDSCNTLDMAYVEKEVLAFLNKLRQSRIQKIAVKVSGPMNSHSRFDTSIYRSEDVVSIFQSTKDLLMKIGEHCSVIVEELVEAILPLEIGVQQAQSWSANDALGFRMQVTVCRDHDGTPVTTLVKCAVTERFCTSNDDNIVWQSLDSTLLGFNVFDESVRKELEREIRTQSAAALKVNMLRESLLAVSERGPPGAQTDAIDIDMTMRLKRGKCVPIGTAFSSRSCGKTTHLYDVMMNMEDTMLVYQKRANASPSNDKVISVISGGPTFVRGISEKDLCSSNSISATEENKTGHNFIKTTKNIQECRYNFGRTLGKSVRPFVRNMISRSQRYVMKGKQIVVIAGGTYMKRKLWPVAARYGIKVILFEPDPKHRARKHVYRFIQYDFDDHSKDEEHAVEITNLLQQHGIKANGCLTIKEECVPLVALINEKLGTKGDRYEAAVTAKKKSRTQNLLNRRCNDTPHWPRVNLYTTPAVHLKTTADCSAIPESFKFPAMLKFEHGNGSVGAIEVKNKDEMMKRFLQFTDSLRSNSDCPGIGLSHGNSMMAMEFYEGSEHMIDVTIYDRKLVGAIITDSGRVRRPYATATARCMPSTLPRDKQAQLITASYQCCTEIGLTHGVYNVEMMMTATGPKLLEINARLGGYVYRDWALEIYGVDPFLNAMMIASDIKPYIFKHPTSNLLMGVKLLPSIHANTWTNVQFRNLLNQMIEREEIFFIQFYDVVKTVDSGYERPFANIGVSASTSHQAKSKLIDICRTLGVDKENYRVSEILQHF